MRVLSLAAIAALLSRGAAFAQSDIDPAHPFSWGENVGWMNWREAGDPPASLGVRVHPTFLAGFIWGENAGWIDVGGGSPANGTDYANLDASDFGVNIDANGDLFGYAWGENIGWVVFDTREKGDQRARLDRAARRFRGYAWGENAGWINLDDEEAYVGILAALFLRGDANDSGQVDIADAIHTLGCLFQGTRCTRCMDAGDSNDDGGYDISDAIHTIQYLFVGGRTPPDPGPQSCGSDPTEDPFLDCTATSCT